ncbi:TrbI/VirB10 family protein [Paraburkholderia youngii]|uniref:TrbI/VirB10 family protein n=1 Tax=Paraburkholderia youngii TaxID=2782701 RepID=UPI003D22A0CC
MSSTFKDPFAEQHQAPPRPIAEPPKSAQSPERKSSADMTKSKPKRNMLIWFVLPFVIAVMVFMLWPHKRRAPTVQAVDAQTVDNTNQNGQQIIQAAKEAEGASEAQRARAAALAAAAAPAPGAQPVAAVGSHDPNAYAASAIGQTNYAAGTTSYAANGITPPPGGGADSPNARAAAARTADEEQRQRAEEEKRAQKAAEIAAAEIQSNNVATMKETTANNSSSSAAETPQARAARMIQDLQESQSQQTDAISKAMQLAAGGSKDGATTGLATTHAGQQDQWLSSQTSDGGKVTQMQPKASGFIIDEGTAIRTVLITGLNTDAPGVVTAQVTSDVYDSATGDQLLIPRGTKVIGSYNHNINNGQTRVLVALTRMIRPDGTWIDLSSASGAEMNGEGGLEGDVNNHFFKIFGSALVIGAATLLLDKEQQQTTVSQGLGTTQMGGTIFAQTLQQVMNQLLEKNKDIPPTITRDAGTEFIFMVRRDMSLTPYHRSSGVRS